MTKTWTTTIDSDIGSLELRIKYDIESGERGDYNTPSTPAYVNITDYEIILIDEPPLHIVEELELEIEEYECDKD